MKTRLLYGIVLNLICSTYCIQVSAQRALGDTFRWGSFRYEITLVHGSNTSGEVAVLEYLDLNNLTPTIPLTARFGGPYDITSIKEYVLNSKSLTSITILAPLRTIGEGAFNNNSLTSISIPSSTTNIGENAFRNNLLTSVTIPSSVTNIGAGAFINNPNLTAVISQSTSPATLLNGTFSDNSLIDLTVPTGFEQTYIDANWMGFKTINSTNYTFTQNDIVYQIIDIVNNLVAVYDYVGTSTTVTIPATISNSGVNYSVSTIASFAFANNALTSVSIPTSIITIGASAFHNNALTSVIIPAFVTTIGAFAFRNNFTLTAVTSESINPARIASFTFFNNNFAIDLTIPAGTSDAYSAARWINFNSVTEAACNVNIPDANFKAALIANTAINTNSDTEIQCSEATAFTETINVSSKSISDLTGIEAFVGITSLNCSNNSLTNLNVSSNTALIILNCGSNQLSSLDVSVNTALQALFCYENQLNTLDVSQNIELANLQSSSNQLVTLDVSSNVLLKRLGLNSNSLMALDVSNNTLLEVIALSDNQILTIDFSNNPALKSVAIANGILTSLDLSANPSINYLFARNNDLQSLDVSNGNNSGWGTNFFVTGNPNLMCIQIDSGFFPTSSWQKDATASYSTSCAALSVYDFTLEGVSLSPNPTNSIMKITMNTVLKQATIYSVLGNQVLKTNATTINTSSLKRGVYLIKIENEAGAFTAKRFVKE